MVKHQCSGLFLGAVYLANVCGPGASERDDTKSRCHNRLWSVAAAVLHTQLCVLLSEPRSSLLEKKVVRSLWVRKAGMSGEQDRRGVVNPDFLPSCPRAVHGCVSRLQFTRAREGNALKRHLGLLFGLCSVFHTQHEAASPGLSPGHQDGVNPANFQANKAF